MKLRIEKQNYSMCPWRLVNEAGKDVSWSKPMKHPDLGWTVINSPICGQTKQECIDEALDVLAHLVELRRQGK